MSSRTGLSTSASGLLTASTDLDAEDDAHARGARVRVDRRRRALGLPLRPRRRATARRSAAATQAILVVSGCVRTRAGVRARCSRPRSSWIARAVGR
jgi:hypothetical protein